MHDILEHLAPLGLHAQKKSYLYGERRSEERQAFAQQIATIAPEDRVYLDEAGVADTLDYAYGWSLKGTRCGTRCRGERLGHRTQRVSMIAAWCQGQVLAPMTFEGYCHSVLGETWCEQFLLPVLRRGQVVILDNASFHRKKHWQRKHYSDGGEGRLPIIATAGVFT